MKTYKNVQLNISQTGAQFLIVAAQLERDRLKKGGLRGLPIKGLNDLIDYMRKQLDEAQTPNETDKLIDKIARWD